MGLEQPVLPHLCSASGRCLRDVPEDVPPPVRSGPGSLLHGPRPQLGRPAQEDRSGARAGNRLRPPSRRGCEEVFPWCRSAMSEQTTPE